MTIPTDFESSKYPVSLDTNQNLFLVHDALRVTLAEDYDPNDDIVLNRTKIFVDGDTSNFPDTGIITLTEQCSEINKRAISFFYSSKTTTTFEGLVPIPEFENSNNIIRPKRLTNVTQNVMAEQHNALKNALIAIENFVGVKGTTDIRPFGDTMEGRINFLRKLVLSPRAWFTATNTVGLVPLTVVFKNESFRLGDDEILITWDFGDQDSNIPISSLPLISVTDVVPISSINVRVLDTDSKTVEKTYTVPNNYTVTLTVENAFGSDTVVFEDFINARTEAPDEAVINFSYTSDQNFTSGSPAGGPFDEETPPKIRSRTNKFINLIIPDGINGATGRSYSGEELDLWNNPIDPIETYTWELSDDLSHANDKSTQATYSIGGLYDLALRCDTIYGAYRITNYNEAIDIIEDKNMWLFTLDSLTAKANEFGLISETFKTGTVPYSVNRNSDFLSGTNNEEQAVKEFNRNTSFAANSTVNSGDHGTALLLYANGGITGSSLDTQTVTVVEFEGFNGTFANNPISIIRPWNWIFLPFEQKSYFLFGADPTENQFENKSYQIKDTMDISGTLSLDVPGPLVDPNNFINGASELINHVTSDYDEFGEPVNGRFAVYRSTVKNSIGYFLRNDGVGNFYKIRQFYRTEGSAGIPVENIRKLQDMSGSVKTEGELVSLTNGLFFFNNSGNISAFNIASGTWEVGNTTSPFRTFQDSSVDGYSDQSNGLLACSDGERIAYLSFDYSNNAFVKYNSVDKTFSSMTTRPNGEQWIIGIY